MEASRKRGLKLDYMGFGLLAVGFGSLQFVLDKGQEDDWFGSHLIATFFVLCAAALVALILWEIAQIRRGHRPILDLTMFRNRTFCDLRSADVRAGLHPVRDDGAASRCSCRR